MTPDTPIIEPKTKVCTVCKLPRDLRLFNKHHQTKDGLGTDCRLCKTQRQRERIEQSKLKGLCVRCDEPNDRLPKLLCSSCQAKNSPAVRAARQKRLAQGLCYLCGKNPQLAGKLCIPCWWKAFCQNALGDAKRVAEMQGLWEKQNHRCALSWRGLTLGVDASIDHIIPRSKGGTDEIINLRWVHRWVNWGRSNLSDEEYVSLSRDVVKMHEITVIQRENDVD